VSDIVGFVGGTFARVVQFVDFGFGFVTSQLVAMGNGESMFLGGGFFFGGKAHVAGFSDVRGAEASRSALVPFTLTDGAVRGGAPTAGWLDVTATGRGAGELGRVELHRFIFDDTTGAAPVGVTTATTGLSEYGATSAVPEASTSLGLLALGAGGLLTRRRQKRAA
jgi:hypothetical protein